MVMTITLLYVVNARCESGRIFRAAAAAALAV